MCKKPIIKSAFVEFYKTAHLTTAVRPSRGRHPLVFLPMNVLCEVVVSAFLFSPDCLNAFPLMTLPQGEHSPSVLLRFPVRELFPLRAAAPPLGTLFIHTCHAFIGKSFLFWAVTITELSS